MKLADNQKHIFETSWDDGHPLDLKLAGLLKKYDIPAIFFVPISNHEKAVMKNSQLVELSKMFEIGGHTLNHELLTRLEFNDDIVHQIVEGKNKVEDIIESKIDKFCYPRGYFNKEIKKIVEDAGFKSARTTELFKLNYEDEFEKPTTIHVSSRQLRYSEDWEYYAKHYLEEWKQQGGIFHLWGHSWEIERLGLWFRLEEFFKYLINNYKEYVVKI